MSDLEPPQQPLPPGWEQGIGRTGNVFYHNSVLNISQYEHPVTSLLGSFYYKFDGSNGIAPSEFEQRDAATNILDALPRTMAGVQNPGAITRVLLHGPPASGKSSIMGSLYISLKERYWPTPVYFVQAFALSDPQLRSEAYISISRVGSCVVLLDDAHEWYNFKNFFGLFKGTGLILVAAATYSAEQINDTTLVDFPLRVQTNLTPREINSLLSRLRIDPRHHGQLVEWFGDIYGRYHFLVPPLFQRWTDQIRAGENVTLADTFFSSATMQDANNARHLRPLDKNLRVLLIKVWKGTATDEECATLVPYGILMPSKEWSCEYVRRKYCFELFQVQYPKPDLFNQGLPSELELLKTGLREIQWDRLGMSRESSVTLFPVEDIWQAEFYASIGQYVPQQYVFCKEYTTSSRNHSVDFVLRNGDTRAIKFLINSDRIPDHHQRFESGAYRSLRLSGSYLVVDIKPWDNTPDIHEATQEQRMAVANECFSNPHLERPGLERRQHHAVFLVSNSIKCGLLYFWDEANGVQLAVASGRF